MSETHVIPTTETLTTQSWLLQFYDPPDLEKINVGAGTCGATCYLQKNRDRCFEELGRRLQGTGIEVLNPQQRVGHVFLRGSAKACQDLKARVEAEHFAFMVRDDRDVSGVISERNT